MYQRFVCVVLLVILSHVNIVSAFNPPVDKQEGITLSIESFPEEIGGERWAACKVPADQQLSFTVTLKNERKEPVGGMVRLWLNDDWDMISTNGVTLAAAPGKSVSVNCMAHARDSVLNALYPIHALLTLDIEGKSIKLHPIAIFEAEKSKVADKAETVTDVVLSEGLLRLDSGLSREVFCQQKDKVAVLGLDFSGSDKDSGTCMNRSINTRGGVSRAGFQVHPPYRGGYGVTWNDFKLTLPQSGPIRLRFYTALRENSAQEPASDGTEFKVFVIDADKKEKEVFTRFSDSKTWEQGEVDLDPYAGQHITLRLWTGPGPKNNTVCDLCYWGDPVIVVGNLPSLSTEAQWLARDQEAADAARLAVTKKPKKGNGAFRLNVNGECFGAAVVLGAQGLTDGVIAFSDGKRVLTYRGFNCDVDHAPVGGVENGRPVLKVETDNEWGGKWVVTHHVAGQSGGLEVRARLWVDKSALRIAWDMPKAERSVRGTPLFTRLGIGAGSEPVWRAYAGFGNVIENPGALSLRGGGFTLSTRHVGADYPNGLSLLQASDVFPDQLVYSPETRRFALEVPHDVCFMFVPSARGAFDAARACRDICGFRKGPGVDALLGRMCIDQWGGDYLEAAKGLREAGRYGLNDSVFVKHVWQLWGYDYRLPEIYPPRGGMEPFLVMRKATEDAGMLFCPHDNYIDFYPDAAGYSYDHIIFNENGTPQKAWFNEGRKALSYRWMPHAFRPWMEENMRLMRGGFRPDSLFIDVFTAMPPVDYYDRSGKFYPRTRTSKEWGDAFDICRKILKSDAPMLSEAGTDALIGSLDGGQADHFHATRWTRDFGDACRTPWHDMVTHGKMVLLAGGLGPRYSAVDWHKADRPLHGYGSDDYLSNTVMGGRNPMCDGPFSRRTVMTYWLLHDVCDVLARSEMETHTFGTTIRQQHTTFSNDGKVWANRSTNTVWTLANGKILPSYGFYAETEKARAGIVMIDGLRAAFAESVGTFFADARPLHRSSQIVRAEAATTSGNYLGNGKFEVTVKWTVSDAPIEGYTPFVHICGKTPGSSSGEDIAWQVPMSLDVAKLQKAGTFDISFPVSVPNDMPAGSYKIRYGLYKRDGGNRLPIRGLSDGGQRIMGGILTVAKKDGAFTEGSFSLEQGELPEEPELNVDSKMLDFGPVVTDGAFRLMYSKPGAWELIPLPGSKSFRAELYLAKLSAKARRVKRIECVESSSASAQAPKWSQDGDMVKLSCDGQSFAYRIEFGEKNGKL